MELKRFKISNYRSINDSGWIDTVKMTALVGRNESGKSNLLLALSSLNPASGMKALSQLKDFPRDRDRNKFSEDLPVVDSVWQLSTTEIEQINSLWGRDIGVSEIAVKRDYTAKRSVHFPEVKEQPIPFSELRKKLRALDARVDHLAAAAENSEKLRAAYEAFKADVENESSSGEAWAEGIGTSAKAFRSALTSVDGDLGKDESKLEEIEDFAIDLNSEAGALGKAEALISQWLPTFIYVEDFTPIAGKVDVQDYLNHRQHRETSDKDRNFAKLCKVAGLTPKELVETKPEDRTLLTNRASAQVSRRIRALWSDRCLTVDFRLDGSHFDTYVADPNSDYPVLVNLDERSRGLRWFFSFFVTYLADTDDGDAANAVLLLDEPGLFLHAGSQKDLLSFLKTQLPIQSIYTTHSPFMVPADDLDVVRTVNISADVGTTVSNDPSGDQKTLFPIQAALGFSLAQSLFVGPKNVVVEGVTDFWILSAVSAHLQSLGRTGLHIEAAITPAGGAQKVPYMVSLLTSQDLNVVVLLDDEQKSRETGKHLTKAHHFNDKSVIYVTDAFGDGAPKEADIEDLLDPTIYLGLAAESHAGVINGSKITLEHRIPRVVKRLEVAYKADGLEFNKTKAARLFLRRMGESPELVLDSTSLDRFERLFEAVNARLD